jgi:vancomycin resistance protein VanJ
MSKRTGRPITTAACWAYFLSMVALWIFIRQMGDRSWMATLLMILPKWPLLLPVVVLLPMAGMAKSWWLRAVVAAAAAVVTIPLMGFRVAVPTVAPDRVDLRLLTFNVHRQHVDADQLAQYIATVNPDVILLQDWSSSESNESVFAHGGWHVGREGELLVASHYPIGKITPLDFADITNAPKAERGAAACFELLAPAGPMNVINVHLASPHSGLLTFMQDQGQTLAENVDRRWRESELVRGLADHASQPLIIAGDFNTVTQSPIFSEHWGDFTDAFMERGTGFGYTYLIDHTQLRIDHILADQSWQPIRCWVGPEAGSPHRPLVADFRFR